ncbi:Non-specific serine/threonine protein kinase [Bertholletia excelsa]
MGSFLLGFIIVFLSCPLACGITYVEFVYPNFTASNLQFVDGSGTFLFSPHGTYKAAMFNPANQQTNFYLCVIHVASHTIIWSANRDAPISNSGKMSLTVKGITITDQDGNFKWSTQPMRGSVSALRLTDTGNLVLLSQSNGTLWESFSDPTDTIVIGQNLPVGKFLSSPVSSGDLSTGDYRFALTSSDALLQWKNMTYWKLSMENSAFKMSNYAVDYMAVNQTGLYLLGHNGTVIVIKVTLPQSDFRIAKLDDSGQFTISSFSGSDLKVEFGGIDKCKVPLVCGKLGLCNQSAGSANLVCSCPPSFRANSPSTTGCAPSDGSLSLPVPCSPNSVGSKENLSSVSYLSLGYGIDYFATDFAKPAEYGVNLSVCQDLCSQDCSCLAVFYHNSSQSCYVFQNEFGSVASSTSDEDRLGFIKTLVTAPPPDGNNNSSNGTLGIPKFALVLLPFTAFFLIVVVGFFWWRRSQKFTKVKSGHLVSASGDLDTFSIPGLPRRFDYAELEEATDNFKTRIGSGGFGAVYMGTLPDKSLVAVKKIINLGVQGKKEFCTEIAIIGNIHHLNLVKLRGFCAQGKERLLVYEYMNRGSLDRTLFGNGPVLEWQERVDIALGTARGLAYLHSGCQQKIIHCDVKPENILLHDHSQPKLSDFGLSKLLSPEQSSLFTTMRGTRGYLAPEWLTSSAVSDKTDVYSFGMVLLEIVSGRKNCTIPTQSHSFDDDNSGGGQSSTSSAMVLVYFPLLALEMHEQGRYLELADPRLEGRVTSEEVEKLVRIALCCVHEEPGLRPSMVTVVSMLEGEIPLGRPRLESLNFLRFYGRRFAEASTIIAEDSNSQDGFVLYPQPNVSLRSTTKSSSPASLSYISSQQVSGPR